MNTLQEKYDLAVIGGGPAGIMTAGRAGELGAKVVLLEKNRKIGVKLLLTGKGRCNITNNIEQPREIIERIGKKGKFLFPALHKFGVVEVLNFFESRGVKVKTERGGRVFPVSDSALTVLNALRKYLKEFNVRTEVNSVVQKIVCENNKIEKIILTNGEEIKADNFVIAVGGKSYPETGSSGDGYKWLRDLEHKVIPPTPALVPIITKEKIVKKMEGLGLKNVEISLYKNGKKIEAKFGEAVFTAVGISGPIILNLSRRIREELDGKLELRIDFKPALSFQKLDQRIQRDWLEFNNKIFKNSLDRLLPQALIPVIIELSEIDPLKQVNSITQSERKKIIHLLKEFKLTIKSLGGYEKAIITAGGVDLKEVDSRNMQSKIIDNLYFAGEILDLDGPTGGFNLQICWSSGYLAGENIGKKYRDTSFKNLTESLIDKSSKT